MASLQASTLSSTAPLTRGRQRSSRRASARGVAVTKADLLSRFFSGGHKSDDKEQDEETARMTQQLASSAQAEVRLLADSFNTEATSTLSPEEAQRRISALLNGADRDAASKARSASNILGRYDGGEDGMNRMAVAAAKDEIKWSKKFTLSLDVNQNRAEKLIRSFSDTDAEALVNKFVDASLSLSADTTDRALGFVSTSGAQKRRTVTAHGVAVSSGAEVVTIAVPGWIDTDSGVWSSLEEGALQAADVAKVASAAELPTA